jgi:hypothetical protein
MFKTQISYSIFKISPDGLLKVPKNDYSYHDSDMFYDSFPSIEKAAEAIEEKHPKGGGGVLCFADN